MESDSLPVLSLWESIGRTISGYMLVVDRAHKICFVNRVEEGYAIGDAIGRSIHDFSIPETAEVFRTILADVFANGEVRSLETNGTVLSGKRACYAVHLGPIIGDVPGPDPSAFGFPANDDGSRDDPLMANIRGGGEFGPAWHQAALKEKRPRAYEDFIAVAEDLVARQVTSPARRGFRGGSKGG